jgi:two-component system KDP operon response regulator KdpE
MYQLNGGGALPRRPFRLGSGVTSGRIIVAGSDRQERQELRAALELEGHQITEAETVDRTLEETGSRLHHTLILASEFDGLKPHELCRTIRLESDLGIIVLAGDGARQGRIDALNAGADDFIPVPFVWPELLARVRAILRRVVRDNEQNQQIVLQDRAIDLRSHRIKGPGDREIHLTPKEFLVLKQLISNANKLLTHQSLSQSVWQRDAGGEVEYMRIVIKQLRRKLEPDPDNPRYICTERAAGYRFHLPAASLVSS